MKLKSFVDFAVQRWWIIYGLSLGIFFLYLFIAIFGPPTPKPADEIVFYPWIMLREANNLPTLILSAVFILAIVLFGLKKKSFTPAVLLGVITAICCIIILALFGPALGTIRTGFEPDPTITHVTSIRENQYVYNLAKHRAGFEVIGEAYILYECDSLGISCRAIFRYRPKSLEAAHADLENPPVLSSDSTNIALHIGGKVVYTLPILTNS